MLLGKVKWINRIRGYGFIEYEKGDVFFHHSFTQEFKDLGNGSKVEFEICNGEKGPRATIVKKIVD